ncbi:hypothetical protein MIND_00305400 [Mycena indigotica]|uniref:Uncharacterized protein n=1 Tax=Mycena indigotica TaxID=2126181 RepID=A0A8H6WC38_9AGAR|nr:uncharacterized protein MIND_00305400 [Mycena indigotica]KAF7309348.1 hypothetical protein MIND_00305400 [Mycena indigotica]
MTLGSLFLPQNEWWNLEDWKFQLATTALIIPGTSSSMKSPSQKNSSDLCPLLPKLSSNLGSFPTTTGSSLTGLLVIGPAPYRNVLIQLRLLFISRPTLSNPHRLIFTV